MKLERWNPSIKVLTILVCVILLSFQYLVALNLAVFGLCVLLLTFFSDAKFKAFIRILIPALVVAAGLFIMGLYYAKGNSVDITQMENIQAVPYAVRAAMSTNFYSALQLSTRLLAYAGLGILFSLTTDGELFIQSLMHQCRLSPKFAYGILAAIHLLPNMVREYNAVKLAFASRGKKVHFWNLQPTFVMMVNSIRWSEAIAMAMESKGFDGEGDRTYYHIPKVRLSDCFISIVFIMSVVLGILLLPF